MNSKMNSITSDTITDTDTTLSDSSEGFSHREVREMDKILSENIQELNTLKNNMELPISTSLSLNKELMMLFDEHKAISSDTKTLMDVKRSKEEKLNIKCLRKEINQLKQEINNTSQEIKRLQIENEQKKAVEALYEKALHSYTAYFDFKIDVDNVVDDNKYWVNLIFSDKSDCVCRFLINSKDKLIEDFDAQKFLPLEREIILRNKFSQTGDVSTLICTLRNIVLTGNYKHI